MTTQQDNEELIMTPPPDASDHIDLAAFPEWFQNLIKSVCLAGRCTVPEFAILAAFQAVGAVVGNSARVDHGEYRNPPMLWGVIIARSGFGKTKQHELIMAPLLDIDEELNKKYQEQKRIYNAEIERNKKDGENHYRERPRKQSLIIDDATPEARAARLQDSPNGCILYMDELAGLFQKLGQYSGTGSGEISDLIRYYGNAPVKIDRKNEESNIYIPQPFLSIYGTMQPKVAGNIFKNETLWDQGFSPRWLFVYVTDSPGVRPESEKINPETVREWSNFIFGLRKRYFGVNGKLKLSGGADSLFKEFCRWSEGFASLKCDENKGLIYYKSHASLMRLSLIIQIIKDPAATEIARGTMRTAVNCMYYFLSNAVRFYDDIFQEKQENSSGPAKSTKKDIVEYLWNNGQHDVVLIAASLGCQRQRVYQILDELEKEGKITRPCKQGETPKISAVLKTGSK